jgi:tetratricopeptide (TPR) repeat protein
MEFSFTKVVEWVELGTESAVKNWRYVVLGVAGIFVLILAFLGYGYYNDWVQTSAHKAFVESLRYYDAPVSGRATIITNGTVEFATDEEKWKKVDEVFKSAYQSNKGAGIAPVFRVYQAEALVNLGKIDEAIEMLASAVKAVPSPDLKDFYTLKLALMKMDSLQQPVQQDGLTDLKKIAENEKQFANEAGLYFLGYYFWTQKDFTQAKNYWQQLMVKYGLKETKQSSGFAELVKARLKLISAEW